MPRFSVTKCICHDRSFAALKSYAQKHNIEHIQELQDRNMCSCGCQMCIPYVEQMLKTGETEFEPGSPYGRNSKRGNA